MFKKKKIGEMPTYEHVGDLITKRLIIKGAVILFCIAVVLFLGYKVVALTQSSAPRIGKSTAKAIGDKFGEPMIRDDLGNINVLIAGYAGEEARGGLLTDTMILASFNPKLGATTLLSIPRDLYVNYGNGGASKLNGMYRSAYMSENSHEDGAVALAKKVTEITGVPVPYYMIVDFDGFVSLIDELGGINVNVPSTINDPYFPGPDDGYETFRVAAGPQTFDGITALKYARSRKTTSDSDRSARQQQIIEAVIDRVMSTISLTKMGEIRTTYEKFMNVFKTNISLKQVLGMMKHVDNADHFFSFVYTADCDERYYDQALPGCVLYHANREDFDGLAVMLPDGAVASNLSYYKHTQDFAFWVVYNQEFLVENAPIRVLNGIDKQAARNQGYRIDGVATKLALELKMKGFTIEDITNASEISDDTILYVSDQESYKETIETLKAFVDIPRIEYGFVDGYGSGISLILGNDYLSGL